MKVEEVLFRDCPWCSVKHAAMKLAWSQCQVPAANGSGRAWLAMTCPRCGALVSVEVHISSRIPSNELATIPLDADVQVIGVVPNAPQDRYRVDHLPGDVERFFTDALRVIEADVPDAAAVQLRRTIEASAIHKDAGGRNLVEMVEKMIEKGLVTRDFGDVLTHVRKLGNIGAHASDERLTTEEVHRALSFTTQFLRNVFEVPGELAALSAESDDSSEQSSKTR